MEFSVFLGKTITKIVGAEKGSEIVRFDTSDGKAYVMQHLQDCCERVSVEDVCGDLADLIGSPVVRAEQPSSMDGSENVRLPDSDDSHTWTFYILGTAKGTVTIRWYGTSNGYYGEKPHFDEAAAA